MRTRRSTSLVALTAIAAMALAGVLAAPGAPAAGSAPTATVKQAAGTGTLAVSPARFVGGQSLTWTGRLPRPGVRTITMQRFLNRPGDSWLDVDGFSARTRADGSFSFRYPAPDMIDIGFRVKSGALVTEKLDLFPDQQDVVLWAEQLVPGSGRATATTTVTAGLPFVIVADTAPKAGMPVFPGRVLTLQRRVGATAWLPVGVTVVGPTGEGRFLDLTQGIGTPVYRVVEADVTSDGNRIGWYPSFPTYFDVVASTDRPAVATRTPERPDRTTYAAAPRPSLRRTSQTAALRWNWGYPIFDFDWTSGESLTSKPWRGSRPRGVWTEYLGGTGRVAKRSGQLGLSSGRTDRYGSGNRGTTATTLHGNAQSYGRWEVKLRTVTLTGGARYLVRAELVPERARDYDCGAHNITIAEVQQGQATALIGAAKGTTRWTRTINLGGIEGKAPSVAVELMDDHVTWFADNQPVGVLKARRITGGVPMTLRLSLVGVDGGVEMANTTLLSDWQRGFPLNRSPGVLKGPSLTKSTRTASCGG
ncbi:hypothetical protein [Nocardioides sp. T2.26MG-1]|uniref:hypothetical protein n=1 Tax=Nocardioides sp. T2.26MG-1 TaxID=3041166 RepID=UPI0024776CC5|nr:hypothetical protein [Nocardioides sp. T2.26MG-1]CAI9398862.1 hypothetical protein HIDPHFAB_00078 [Nocardioides sp. T2.26MG-1]